MTEIDVAEFNSREAAKFSLANLDVVRARAHQLLLVLLGGAGGLGAVGVAQWSGQLLLAVSALSASAWWFAWAAYVAVRALGSSEVRAWALTDLVQAHEEWVVYAQEVASEGGSPVDTVAELRKQAIRAAERARDGYMLASADAYAALDLAYRAMAATPLWVAGCVLACWVGWLR